jgi:Ca2+-binding RTX toxin-like protein
MPFPATLSLSSLTSETGHQINGSVAGAEAGSNVLLADLNGDGFIDLAVSAPLLNGYTGAAYVIFGTASGIPTNIGLADLDGTNGYAVTGRANTGFGSALAAGDVNGDGIEDLLIGGSAGTGLTTVVFGQSGPVAATRAYTDFTGDNGFNFNGQRAGYSVSAGGDINGDGIDDLVVSHHTSAVGGAYSGVTYVVFGKTSGWAANESLSGLDGSNGFRVVGLGGDNLGQALEIMDINGDGIDDLLMGAPGANAGFAGSGAVYIVYGKASGWAANLSVGALDGANGMTLTANLAAGVGRGVKNLGDINSDGREDLGIVGSNTTTGYVLYGPASSGPSLLALNALDGADGFRFTTFYSSSTIVNAGDVNGDGYGDLVVGSRGGNSAGSAFVLFGSADGWAAVENLGSLNGQNGFTFSGEAIGDQMGRRISAGHDLNGDGLADIVVGARGHDAAGSGSGAIYIVYGQQGDINRIGTAAAETLTGNIANDTLSGLDGKDLLYGLAGNDTLLGGAGGDLLDGGIGADAMSGGTGDDTYIVDDAGDLVTELGGEGVDRVRASITFTLGSQVEHLNLEGSGDIDGTGNAFANQINGNSGANTLTGAGGADILRGNAGDDLLYGDAGADQLLGGDGVDEIDGGADNDILQGNANNDTLYGGEGLDTLDGGAGVDMLYGQAGNDRLNGGEGADVLSGGADNDVLTGGAGADLLFGGLGDDTYILEDVSDTLVEAAGEGSDVVRAYVNWNLGDNFERLILEGSATQGGGNDLANHITGNDLGNTLEGRGGADVLFGAGGGDVLIGGAGNDTMTGGAGTDGFFIRSDSLFTSSNPGGRTIETDTITDYASGIDLISFSDIDANPFGGTLDDAFTIVTSFTGAPGQMTVGFAGGVTTVLLDWDGDRQADYRLRINGDFTSDTGNWVL